MKKNIFYLIGIVFTLLFGCEEKKILPDPCFKVSEYIILPNELINFESCTLDSDSVRWDMGDGTIKTEDSFDYSYSTIGDYYVILHAFNKDGETEVVKTISVVLDKDN